MSGARFDPHDERPLTRVVVGILWRWHDSRSQVLLAQRPAGKPYAGYWEFPGGKIEAEEDAATALVRELEEELGIQVIESQPLATERFSYEHAHVELDFRLVSRFLGEPTGCEGQPLSWQQPDAIMLKPLLPALLHPRSQVLRKLAALNAQEVSGRSIGSAGGPGMR